jgi:hypothetical protein
MICGIRVLVALAAMALVLVAGFATTAQAVEFHAETAEGKLTATYPKGEQGGEGEAFNFITPNGIAPCLRMSSTGPLSGKTLGSVALLPTLSECFFTTKMNGCNFVFAASGTFSITGGECATKPIEIVRGACVIKFGPQEKAAAITYENGGTGTGRDVTATLKATKLHFIQTGSFCNPGVGTYLSGEIIAKVTFKADTPEAVQQGFWVE